MDQDTDQVINEILDFWFSKRVKKLWFNSTAAFDQELRDKYLMLLNKAESGELAHWSETANGALALVIILDQFPLNMFRNQARGFSTEQVALQVATQAIRQEFDSELKNEQKAFLYLPFMHSENMSDQNRCVELFDKAGLEESLEFAKHHRSIVQRFGRFPHRNKILGRESSNEELEYLQSDEAFLG